MTATQKTKMVDKLTLGKKLVALLKKRYHTPLPKHDRPVLETLLFSICLEDVSVEDAEAAYQRLMTAFHDLNELRVSSITELAQQVFDGFPEAEFRADRVRNVLHYVFEKHFEFALEGLRRKTLELATKQLTKIRNLSSFNCNYTLQSALGTHIVPVDRLMTNAAVWLGFAAAGESPEQAAETLKSAVRKADVLVFAHYLRCLAVDPRLVKSFEPAKSGAVPAGDPQTIVERLETLFREASAAGRKSGKKPSGNAGRSADGRDRPKAASATRKKK